ncbi:MAG: hypothetical protein V5A55_01915 [Halovenus sp.]
MTREAEFYVEKDRTRAIGDVHLADGADGDPLVGIDPHIPSLTVGSDGPQDAGELRFTQGSETLSSLSAKGGSGSLTMQNAREGEPYAELDADGATDSAVTVLSGDNPATKIVNATDSGAFAVLDVPRGVPIVDGAATGRGGLLAVEDFEGNTTCELLADDAVLRLSDGEAIVKSEGADADDIHVHIQGKSDDDSGVEAANRPRMHFDGPEATLDLGRGELDEDRNGVDGEVSVRGEDGNSLLELRATDDGAGELRLRGFNGSNFGPTWSVVAHPDGLMIRDANAESGESPENLLLITNRGELKAAGSTDTF